MEPDAPLTPAEAVQFRRDAAKAALLSVPEWRELPARQLFDRLFARHVQYHEFEAVRRDLLGAEDPALGPLERQRLAAAAAGAPQEPTA